MEVLTLLIAVIALVIAVIALQRTGGIQDLRHQLEEISAKSEGTAKSAREAVADALDRLEHLVRGQKSEAKEGPATAPSTPPSSSVSSPPSPGTGSESATGETPQKREDHP